MDTLESILKSLPEPDESRLVGLEARVWQQIENSRPYAYFSALPLWLKSLPVLSALVFGGVIGASANPAGNDLDVFSSTPAYSVSNLMAACCD